MSVRELMYGLRAKNARSQLARATNFLRAHEEFVPTSEDYWVAAEIDAALHLAGKPIGDADALIAACAMNRDMLLATANTRHYQFIVEVGFAIRIENWREENPG